MRNDDRNPLVREALRWFVLMRDEEATAEERADFERWKSKSPEHAAAWDQAVALWSAFEPVGAELRQIRRRELNRRVFLCSGIGLLAAGATSYMLYGSDMFVDFRTGSGERRSFTLSDGSVMELDSRTSVSLDYSAQRRRLVLHRGEAYFTVAADRQRPFIVSAAGGETRALGTRFNIHTEDDLVTVTVAEHAVEVSLPGAESQRLESGWQLSYDENGLSPPVAADIASVEAWRGGRLVYQGAPLRRVLRDIERHRGGYVVLLDERLGETPVSAAFGIASADAALDSIAQMLAMRVVRAGGLVVIYGR